MTVYQYVLTFRQCKSKLYITMAFHHDKLYDKSNEMHFLEFYSGNILYMFRIDKLYIFRRQFYCTCSLWYVSCIHVDFVCMICYTT